MTQEQKARAYDEAIERAREVIKNNPDFVRVTPQLMEEIFPELAEAEDSRISKEICDFICWATDRGCITKEQVEKSNSWLAWLGKQGEQKPAELPKGEDYGIDGLWHAISILQRTLGEVEGYQSDDGILEHKCAISAVKELYERKPAWSEEDESILDGVLTFIPDKEQKDWLKSLKDKVQLQPKQEWSEEDEQYFKFIENLLVILQVKSTEGEIKKGINSNSKYYYEVIQWLKSLKNRINNL